MSPVTIKALQQRIAELEQQLTLSDQGNAHLAQRCLALEQELQGYLAAHARKDTHLNAASVQLKLFYDRGFGYTEQDSLAAPQSAYQESSGTVAATFELPCDAKALRLDPGELPCYISELTLSDDRCSCAPVRGILLDDANALFLQGDPNFQVQGLSRYPAGMKLGVAYQYHPLPQGSEEPLFEAMLRYLEQTQSQLEAARQDSVLQSQQIAQLNSQLSDAAQENQKLNEALEAMLNSRCWKLTGPLRRLLEIFHRG